MTAILLCRKSEKQMENKFHISIEANANKAHVKIRGLISSWQNSSDGFEAQIEQFIKDGIQDVVVSINSGGGSVFEAFEIYNLIKKFPGKIEVEIGALAASAATIIASGADHVSMAANGNYMIHRPMVMAGGNEDELESSLKALKNVKASMLKMYKARTGMSESKIERLWKNDYWMTADEAKEKGFIDSVDGEVDITKEDVQDVLANTDWQNIPQAIRAVVTPQSKQANQSQANNPQNEEEMKVIAVTLGLGAEASEGEVNKAIKALQDKASKYDALKKEIADKEASEKETKITSILDKAIQDNKFSEEYRATFKSKLEANFEAASKEIEAIKPVGSLIKAAQQESNADGNIPSDRKDWTYADWAEKDEQGLKDMMENNVDHFKKLYKAEYGVEATWLK